MPKKSGSVSHSVMTDSATPWTVAHQALLYTEFFRQEYWSGLPCPSPGDLPNPLNSNKKTQQKMSRRFRQTIPKEAIYKDNNNQLKKTLNISGHQGNAN